MPVKLPLNLPQRRPRLEKWLEWQREKRHWFVAKLVEEGKTRKEAWKICQKSARRKASWRAPDKAIGRYALRARVPAPPQEPPAAEPRWVTAPWPKPLGG